MKLYTYYISIVIDNGLSSMDEKATSKKEAFNKLKEMKNYYLTKSFVKECESIELYIDRKLSVYFITEHDNIYYKKIK